MIYSQWRPDKGGYDYFETPGRLGLGDDLPRPAIASVSAIGAASTELGRPLPPGARHVGSGELARGSVAPMSRRGLSLSGLSLGLNLGGLGAVVVGAVFGWWLRGRRR